MKSKTGRCARTVTALFAAGVMLLSSFPANVAFAATVDDLEQQQAELQRKKREAQKKLDDLKASSGSVQERVEAIEDKIDLAQRNLDLLKQKEEALNAQLNALNQEIAKVEQQIEAVEKEIHRKQISFDERYEAFADRLCAMYVSGVPTTLEAFLSAEDFSGFLISAELLSSVSRADREALEALISQMNDIRKSQEKLSSEKEKLSQRQAKLLETKKEQEAARAENEQAKAQYEKEEAEANAELKKYNQAGITTQKDIENFDKTIKEIYDEINRKEEENKPKPEDPTKPEDPDNPSPPVSDGMTWPAPKCGYITTYFDPQGINGRRHRGVDLAAAGDSTGLPIVAADSGTVTYTDVGGWGDSYGSYMIIRHANGLSTLYAHCSEVWVKKGQTVKKGQQIGRVGNTGNSRGAHLHFEVRDRTGVGRLNPLDYIKWGR